MDTENKQHIELSGKIAKFPKGTKAFTALQYLEKVRVNPSKLWYVIVENQNNELKLVKYNRNKGVDLLQYTLDLKQHYKTIFENNKNIILSIESIEVIGEQDFSIIKNIPNIIINESTKLTLLGKITKDLIKLLSN